MANRRLWVWAPARLTWWTAVLFMIGAALFALGCVLFLASIKQAFVLDSVFFVGSLFFTSAAYCQYHQALNETEEAQGLSQRQWFGWQPQSISFWSAGSQFVGTLLFNINTFDAFFDFGWIAQDILIWTPNMLGSIMFQLSGSLAMYEACRDKGNWHVWRLHWWVISINFLGCVAFLISAVLSLVTPAPVPDMIIIWATVFTLLGAGCFFASAYLMVLEMRPTTN